MAKPFDTTTKQLIELQPADWLRYVGLPDTPVQIIDADLATVVADADKLMLVGAPPSWVLLLELQSYYETDLEERLLQYAVLARRRHGMPLRSIVILLRPQADGPALTGRLEWRYPDGVCYLQFSYQLVRAWEKSVDAVLAGGLGTLPLAPLADVAPEALPGVVRRMEERIDREASPAQAGLLWTATYLLMGLRYDAAVAARILAGVQSMKESVTYQAILREGGIEALQDVILRLGTKRFGAPSDAVRLTIESITELPRLELLCERLLDVERWEELLAG